MARKVRAKKNLEYDTVYRETGQEFYLIKDTDFNPKVMEWAAFPTSIEVQKALTPALPHRGRPQAVPDDSLPEVPALPSTAPALPAKPAASAAGGDKPGTGDSILI